MTITHSVQQEFLDDETKNLICIPCRFNSPMNGSTFVGSASETATVHHSPVGTSAADSSQGPAAVQPLSLSVTPSQMLRFNPTPETTKGERWTEDEHERFLLGMELFKAGPWKKIAGVVGTRDARQTMSHAQKYRQKIKRRKLGLQTHPEHARRIAHNSRPTSATKRVRTAIAAGDAHTTNRVEGSHASPKVQLPREALDDAERVNTTTGLIPAAANVASSALDSVMVGAAMGRTDPLRRQLEAALVEPLEIGGSVSVVADRSWLGPDELWNFLDGQQDSTPAVVGACDEAALGQ